MIDFRLLVALIFLTIVLAILTVRLARQTLRWLARRTAVPNPFCEFAAPEGGLTDAVLRQRDTRYRRGRAMDEGLRRGLSFTGAAAYADALEAHRGPRVARQLPISEHCHTPEGRTLPGWGEDARLSLDEPAT